MGYANSSLTLETINLDLSHCVKMPTIIWNLDHRGYHYIETHKIPNYGGQRSGGKSPEEWHNSTIIPISKSRNKFHDVDDYRPSA